MEGDDVCVFFFFIRAKRKTCEGWTDGWDAYDELKLTTTTTSGRNE